VEGKQISSRELLVCLALCTPMLLEVYSLKSITKQAMSLMNATDI